MKKKLLAFMLVMTMVLGMSTTSMADDDKAASPEKEVTFHKVYNVSGQTETTEGSVYPAETLSFVCTPSDSNPDKTANITISDVVVTGTNMDIKVKIPEISELGEHVFTITETEGSTQGVGYSEENVIIKVLVVREMDDLGNYVDANGDGYLYLTQLAAQGTGEGEKNDTFNNNFELGNLCVAKKVTGNDGNLTKEFPIKVTFTATNTVKNDITFSGDNNGTVPSGTDGWTGSKEVLVNLAHGEDVTFNNIPAGVTYVVEEVLDAEGDTDNDPNKAYGHTPSYDNSVSGKIENNNTARTTVTNTKDATVATGIFTNNLPYIVALLAVALAAVAFMRRRREF